MPIESFSTDRPAFFVDGVARPPLDAGLIELLIEDSLTGPSSCHATFQNWGAGSGGVPSFLHFDRSVLDIGKPVRVDVPSGSGSGSLFEGFIDLLEADFPPGESPRISFAAIPTLHAFRTTPRTGRRSLARRSGASRTFDQASTLRRVAADPRRQPDPVDRNLGRSENGACHARFRSFRRGSGRCFASRRTAHGPAYSPAGCRTTV